MAKRMSALTVYLGDSVYARIERGTVVLMLGDSFKDGAEALIILERPVLDALLRYLTDHGMIGEVCDVG